jgi:succinate dehydrogenase (ubiquinone) flavoprotein subunit
MGGIPTKYTGEVITQVDGKDVIVPNLYAAGECASASVHGANRLGANSLLDIVVFGRACAHHIADCLKPDTPHAPLPEGAGEASIANLDKQRFASGTHKTADVRAEMQQIMQNSAAVFRTHESLEEGVKLLAETAKKVKDLNVTDRSMIWYVGVFNIQEFRSCRDP